MPEQVQDGGITRRRFVRDAGFATVVAADLLATPGVASHHPKRRPRATAAIFGGGIAGLTAAHELIERGFDVTVYERRAWGGKARSTDVPGSATDGRKPLPGEHAYRVEFGCYQNVPDTMRRIPFRSNPNGVFDNMVGTHQILLARTAKPDLVVPLASLDPRPYTPQQVIDFVIALLIHMEIPPAAAAYLGNRIAVFASSSDERRAGQWEKMSWREFLRGDQFGADFALSFERFFEFVQAAKGNETRARYPAWVLETWFIHALLGRGTNGPVLRHLDLPTNEAWIYPWIAHLRNLGARLRRHHELLRFDVRNGRITSARLRTPRGRRKVVADWYVCALPLERARKLWSPAIVRADPALARMNKLAVAWYSGISYFLRERARIVEGLVFCGDSPWAASFITQAQYWPVDISRTYGDGTVNDKLSAVVADWNSPGVLYGKPAHDLTPDQLALDLWEQIKQHVNDPGRPPALTDAMLHSWQIDPGLIRRRGRWINEDPLGLPTVDSDQYRPEASTAIHNLMLRGDYLKSPWEVTNMETACYNGRRAANAILDASGSYEAPARAIEPWRPPEWEPLKRLDADRCKRGQPNLFDADLTPIETMELLGEVATT